jgi:hypothetical protein
MVVSTPVPTLQQPPTFPRTLHATSLYTPPQSPLSNSPFASRSTSPSASMSTSPPTPPPMDPEMEQEPVKKPVNPKRVRAPRRLRPCFCGVPGPCRGEKFKDVKYLKKHMKRKHGDPAAAEALRDHDNEIRNKRRKTRRVTDETWRLAENKTSSENRCNDRAKKGVTAKWVKKSPPSTDPVDPPEIDLEAARCTLERMQAREFMFRI